MTRMRQGVALMTVVVSLVALGAARPSRRDGWDPRIAPIARQVERLRHLDFEHAVEAVFLTDKAFRKRVTSDEEKLTKQDRRELRVGEAELRALGLVSSDFDLLATVDEVAGEGILAYYDSEKENIVVRGKKLDAEARVTLVHELTHALQDQHYDLDKLQDHIETSGADDALTALLEGDATRIEGDYYWDLSRKERALIDEAEGTDGPLNPDESPADAGEGFVGAQVESPYALGPPMVDVILADGGRKGLAAAFRKPPTSQLALLSPTIAVDPPAKVRLGRPVVPKGARRIDLDYPDDMGALDLFFLLASRLPDPIALHAADAWGDGKELLTRQGADTCVDLSFVGRTRGGSARIADALRLWAAAMPAGSVELSKNGRTLHACDPGDAAAAPPRSAEDALTFVAARAYLTGEFVDGDAPTVIARCLGEKMIDRPEFQAMATPEGFAAEPTDDQVDDISAMVDQLIEVCV